MSTREIWRPVPSVKGLLASSLGRIMVTPWGGPRDQQYGGTPTAGQWDGKRYIYPRRGHKTLKVARLVCEAFKGPPPPSRPCCLHRDEDAHNNKPGNLKWGTQRENLNAPGFLAYCRSRTGENSPIYKSLRRRHGTEQQG